MIKITNNIVSITYVKFSLVRIVLGSISFLVALILIIQTDYKAFIFLFIGITCYFIKPGVSIDFDNKKIKKGAYIFNLSLSSWKSLPKLEKVCIVKSLENIKTEEDGYYLSPQSFTDKSYNVYLTSEKDNLLIFESESRNASEEIGALLSQKLNIGFERIGFK